MIHLEAHPGKTIPPDYIPDSRANRLQQRPAHELVAKVHKVSAPPKSHSLQEFNAPIFDQGSFGSCTGHGSAQALYTTLAARGKKLSFIPSPRGIYTVTRVLERPLPKKGQPPVALTDSGAMPTDIITTISKFGITGIGPMANDGRQSDVDDTNINAEPDLLQLEGAGTHIEIGAYRIDETATNAVEQIVALIAQGFTVGIGFFCDSIFQAYDPAKGPLDSVDLNDRNGGGHWVCFDAYDTMQFTGKRVLFGPNSWSINWGDRGRFSVTANWVSKAVSDAIPFAVGV